MLLAERIHASRGGVVTWKLRLNPSPSPHGACQKTTTQAAKRTSAPRAPIFAPSIVAIDLGKFKSVACGYDAKTGECQYHTFVTERKQLHEVLDRFEPEVVVIEACSLAGWVRDACVAYGYAC